MHSQHTIFDPGGFPDTYDITEDPITSREVQEILTEALGPLDRPTENDDDQDCYRDTTDTEEIAILQLSHDPISAALHPFRNNET